jgi:predicted O-methyltransferase YrrM
MTRGVAIELDYPPSRQLAPRWGLNRPLHAGLERLFRSQEAVYRTELAGWRSLAGKLAAIDAIADHSSPQPGFIGGALTAQDASLLYHFVASRKPRTYLEIGSGMTTKFARRAIKDTGLDTRIISLDPEPRAEVNAICDQVIRTGLEVADLSVFEQLQSNDVLFFDGSHRVFMNSDVTVFMLDVLPMLAPGVVVGIHDIHWPYDYPEMFKDWYWSEQYIVAVYILNNPRVRILMPSRWACDHLQDLLTPLVDLGDEGAAWRWSGTLWFTHADSSPRSSSDS